MWNPFKKPEAAPIVVPEGWHCEHQCKHEIQALEAEYKIRATYEARQELQRRVEAYVEVLNDYTTRKDLPRDEVMRMAGLIVENKALRTRAQEQEDAWLEEERLKAANEGV